MKQIEQKVGDLVIHQLQNYWLDFDQRIIRKNIPYALDIMQSDYSAVSSKKFYENNKMIFSWHHSVTWMIFLYRLSHLVAREKNNCIEAEEIYYLNKIMHSIDWFYQIELPIHFMAEHPLGSVLGRATYNDYLFIYQGTTIGGNRKGGGNKIYYPKLGKNIVLYANATVLGDSKIGNNVIISANTYIINENIPNNCIVFGRSPNIIIKQMKENEIKNLTSAFWKWN